MPFALMNAEEQPLTIQSFEYFVGQSMRREVPASSITQILSLAPASYQSLDIHAEQRSVFVRLSRASLDIGGTLKLGIAHPHSQ